jgi:hypothetical protein
MSKIVKYLREVSVVVIGVAITLSATLWISQKSEKKDLNLYLNAVKMELEENIDKLNKVFEYAQLEINYTNYLLSNDRKLLNVDTLFYYAQACCYNNEIFSFKTYAFEMFKTSGIMRLVDDKELLLTLWRVYDALLMQMKILDVYSELKMEELKKEMLLIDAYNLTPKTFINITPMYNFYKHGATNSLLRTKFLLNNTEEAVKELERYCEK